MLAAMTQPQLTCQVLDTTVTLWVAITLSQSLTCSLALDEGTGKFGIRLRGRCIVLWVPKTCATWADALGITVGSVKRLGVGRPVLARPEVG
jgi:hypothetical protein